MSFAQRITIAVATNGDGVATVYSPRDVTGLVSSIRYVKAVSGGFEDGVDFDVTLERSGAVLWDEDNVDASKTVSPQQPVHSTAGVALTYDDTNPVTTPIYAAEDRIRIAIANGGANRTGTFEVVIA